MNGPDTAPPTVMSGTGQEDPYTCAAARDYNGTSWFGLINKQLNDLLDSHPTPEKDTSRLTSNLFSEQAIPNSNKSDLMLSRDTSTAAPEHKPMSSPKSPCYCTKCLKSQLTYN